MQEILEDLAMRLHDISDICKGRFDLKVCYHVFGIVQGVGFRPFTAVTAERFGVRGTVANKGSYVEILAVGTPEQLDAFANEIQNHPPERAMILGMDCEKIADGDNAEYQGFSIIESEKQFGDIFVSPDIATCDKCKAELFDPKNRRYLHPFINCTQCGPRLTILDAMPYDRERTSMRVFPMCETCESEYDDPDSRRFDAQPNCCPDCGPEVYVIGTDWKNSVAISAARNAIMSGKIVAIKGIGGFHLCCDAKNTEAITLLRERKKRPMKPFALMMRDAEAARRECLVDDRQLHVLTGWQKPILLLQKREDTSISNAVAPDNNRIGIMLPYTPIHMLLFDYPDGIEMTDSLVMTSGNARGAPICRSEDDAVKEIGGFCDLILSHNREIRLRADDSVCDWLFDQIYMIRRSRGFAPLPIPIHQKNHKAILAIGGELKNTFCIAKGGLLYASPYVGDMADIRTVHALRESIDRMCELLEVCPEVIVCDTHPLYSTVTVAQEIAQERDIPVVQVQHHYAHILSCMAENQVEEPVIGVSFDGTGYGADGTVWGGEFMLSDMRNFVRKGCIQPFAQTGGDLSSKEGWRIAVALLRDAGAADLCDALGVCSQQEYNVLANMARLGVNTVTSTSCGRVFDAVAAILGIRRASTFEGEASTALMNCAEQYHPENDRSDAKLSANIVRRDGLLYMDTTALAAEIARRFAGDRSDENRVRLAYLFHAALAESIMTMCCKIREDTNVSVCALSGGVFQNRLLVRLAHAQLTAAGFRVLLHHEIPPNDGGICIGQALYGVFHS